MPTLDGFNQMPHGSIGRREFARQVVTIGTTVIGLGQAKTFGVSLFQDAPAGNPSLESLDVTYTTDRLNMIQPIDMRAYLSRPAAGTTFPAIIVIHDSRGLTDHIRAVARRAAEAGYMAIAPDWRSRLRDPESLSNEQAAVQAIVNIDAGDIVTDIIDTVGYLGGSGRLKDNKVGVLGFSWGGRYSMLSATAVPGVSAAVAFYSDARPSPELVTATTAPLFGIFAGEEDSGIKEAAPLLQEALRKNNVLHEIKTYPGTRRGFHDETDPARYNAEAAKDAWLRTIAHFDKHLMR